MAFDLAFNFRATAGFVTDPAYGVPTLAETYPHTYTNGNGYSINAGWSSGTTPTAYNDDAGNDPRIAGENYRDNVNGSPSVFTVDLSSGSAPGAGNYTVDLAMGAASYGTLQHYQLLDTSTLLIDGTNGGSGFSTLTDHFRDATVADVAATTSWTGATSEETFATTTVNLSVGGIAGGSWTTPAHFRLTLQAGAATAVRRRLMLLGVGS